MGVAFFVEGSLPLTYHTENGIVHDHGDNGQIVADSGTGFVEVHVEGSVASDMHHLFAGVLHCHLSADGGTVTIAHASQTAAGEE